MMIYLIQLYNMINDKELFINLFNDLSYEFEDMGWCDDPETLIEDLLFNHFGLTISDEYQLESITKSIVKYQGKLEIIKTISRSK